MISCLVLALIIPLIILIVVAIVFGFMALLFTILRFVLPLIIIVAVIWAILNHTNRRPPSGPRRPNPTRLGLGKISLIRQRIKITITGMIFKPVWTYRLA